MTKTNNITGNEQFFSNDEIIVSKTDLKGRITYANRVFLKIAGFSEREIFGQPHSIIRHPDMPRCIFKLLWDTIQNGTEIFAYVINRCKNGDHYWVYAHVTPSFDQSKKIIGYHSNRRVPNRRILDEAVIPLYQQLLVAEQQPENRKKGLEASMAMVAALLAGSNLAYDEFVMTLGQEQRRGYR
ncbi:putative sensor (PAS) domain for methyl-accepting chemotaxis sensory transducer [hydrothermal vent metagenome]|uniref:Putative sensor (PAS) domain for methyl-accepting chemotaxis sensory transducer n=1 Tax=hydrothermal vent metagenome TaxID=652676 RepID=A0A3B0SZ24_9ZZZZ